VSVIHLSHAAELQLERGKKLVLMAICDDASKDTRIAYPGQEKLLLWSGYVERSAKRATEELHAEGFVYRLGGGYAGRRREYLVFPSPAEIVALDELAQTKPKMPMRDVLKTLKAVDNSENSEIPGQKKGVTQDTQISGKGVISSRKGVPQDTPPVITPVTDTYPSSVRDAHQSGPVDNSTDDRATNSSSHPKPHPPTSSNQLDTAAVFASVGNYLVDTGIDDELLEHLGRMIVDQASAYVRDRTRYVIRAFANPVSRPEWIQTAHRIVAERDLARLSREFALPEGNRF
jgi:hypothetical protein